MQTSLDFKQFVNQHIPNENTQLFRLYGLLKKISVTCEDCSILGIAGSALPKRIQDLKRKYNMNIETTGKEIISKFSGKKVVISEYELTDDRP